MGVQLYPNMLKVLAKKAGMRIRDLHEETGISERTLYYWASGNGIIPKEYRIQLAQIIGCTAHDLAPRSQTVGEREMSVKWGLIYTMTDGCFSLGNIQTTRMVLDGDGTENYVPGHIHTHYDSLPATFFEEVREAKKHVEHEQEEKQQNGEPYQWNGEKYHLSKVVVSREPVQERMTLDLWFKPRDHYTGLATRRCLDNPAFREKYLTNHDWYIPLVGMSMSMGVDLSVISSDGFILLTQRGQHQSVHQNMFHTSISEAVSPIFDCSPSHQAPDLYHCASRGLEEELGLHESVDFSLSDILLFGFSVDTHYALYGLQGMVRVGKSAAEIVQKWNNGVRDKTENKRILPLFFNPQEVCSFIFTHDSWTSGGLLCLYQTVVHEFGREEVDTIIRESLCN